MLIFFLAALAAGAARCIIPVYNYHPLLVNGVIHSGILVSVLVVMHFVKKLNVCTAGLYVWLACCLCISQYILQ